MTKVAWLGRAALLAGVGWFAGKAVFVEPYALEETHWEWRLPRLPRALDGLTVCHLTDLHVRWQGRRERDLAALLGRREADLVCLTGDYASSDRGVAVVAEIGTRVRARFGHFAVWGNHEYEKGFDLRALRRRFERAGITVLENEHRWLEINGTRLALAGVDSLDRDRADLDAALRGLPEAAFKILLAHHPDIILDAASHNVDLLLSGHTHGGQVRLPGIGAPYVPSRYQWGMDFGAFNSDRLRQVTGRGDIPTHMYISCGIGTSGLPVRFHCRPEIAWHTLRAVPETSDA